MRSRRSWNGRITPLIASTSPAISSSSRSTAITHASPAKSRVSHAPPQPASPYRRSSHTSPAPSPCGSSRARRSTNASTAPAWRATGDALRILHASAAEYGDELIGAGFGLAARTWPDFVRALLDSSLDGCVRGLGLDPDVGSSIRRAFDEHRLLIEQAPIVRSHGDLQPEHVLLDPRSDQVRAIIDWADQGLADPAWDLAVLTLDDTGHLAALLEGYGPPSTTGVDIRSRRTLYSVLRLLAEALWFAERDHPEQAAAALQRVTIWRAPNPGQ